MRWAVMLDKKIDMVAALNQLNVCLFSYHRFLRLLTPIIENIVEREGRPARILELACGSGEFTLSLAAM